MQKRETAAFQQRRTNMPPPEPHTTDHYDFQMLSSSYHMLQWLADAPYAHICYNIEQLLRQKMADSRLLDFAPLPPRPIGSLSASDPKAIPRP